MEGHAGNRILNEFECARGHWRGTMSASSLPVLWSSDARERVTVFLAFLTSDDCRAACREHGRPEELAAALTRLWFDEIYVPSETAFSGIQPVVNPDALNNFTDAFSESEMQALQRFHGFFELRLNFLSNRLYGRAFFPENDSWRALLEHAGYVLAELDPDYERLQGILAALAAQIRKGRLPFRSTITSPEHPSPRP